MNGLEDCQAQLEAVADFFDTLGRSMTRIPATDQPANNNNNNNIEERMAA
jgi:hypothetical protein